MSSYTSRQFLRIIRVVMVILSVTIYSLAAVTSVVLADDTPPLPPTEETPVAPPLEDNSDVQQVEEAVVEDVVSDATSTPTSEEIPAQPEVPTQNEQALTVDNNPAAQDAESQIMVSDPVWCPEGNVPGEAGCTSNAASLSLLIFGLGTKTGPGTIYFTSTYNNADAQLDYHDVELSGLGAITLQGGWNGNNAGSGFGLSGATTFTTPITVLWNNNVTVNNINGVGVQISTDNPTSVMDITLSDVNMNGSAGTGALLDNGSAGGSGNVVLTGTNTFNNNTGDGLSVVTNGDITVTGDLTANSNSGNGASLDNAGGTGSVSISGTSAFNDNAGDGLNINSNGTVTVQNITAGEDSSTGNGGDGADIKTTGTLVTVGGDNFFNNNADNGLKIASNGAINVSNITANYNAAGNGIQLNAVSDVRMEGTNTVENNALNGVAIYTSGDITIYGSMVSRSNGADGFYLQAASALIRCGYSVSNTGYQLNDHVSGAIGWFGNRPLSTVFDDGSGGISFEGCVFPKVVIEGVTLGLNVIYVNSGDPVILDCNGYYGILLVLPNGDSAYLACPVYGEVTLTSIAQVSEDPPDAEFASGFILDFSYKDIPVTGLVAPVSSKNKAQISFVIPEGKSGDDYDILYWDNGKWNRVENPVFENGKLSAHVDFMGTFILVDK